MRRKRLARAGRRKRWGWIAVILLAVALLVIWLVNIITQFTAAQSFGPELTSLCAGQVYAAELSDAVPGGRLVVLKTGGTRIHAWHNKLPDERRAGSADEVDYVVCLQPSSYTVETCTYTAGGRVQRIRYGYEVLFIEPELGELVALEKVYGPYPDRCPESKGTNLFTEKIKGGMPGFEAFSSLLEGKASDSQPPVIRMEEGKPMVETIAPEPTVAEVE